MKSIYYLVVLVAFISCNANVSEQAKSDSTVKDKKLIVLPVEASESSPTVWIGEFAEWRKGGNDNLDGSYDTSNHIFIQCGDKKGQIVDRSQIVLLSSATCDETPRHLMKIMKLEKKNNEKVYIEINSIFKVTDTSSEHPKMMYKIDNSQIEKTIPLDKVSINKIVKSKELMNTFYKK